MILQDDIKFIVANVLMISSLILIGMDVLLLDISTNKNPIPNHNLDDNFDLLNLMQMNSFSIWKEEPFCNFSLGYPSSINSKDAGSGDW